MNIVTPLVPVAAAALDTVAQSAGNLLLGADAFTRLLHAESWKSADEAGHVADAAPQQSGLGRQVQREALRQRFDALRELAHQRLTQRCAQNGISLSEPVVLVVDTHGRLLEAGNHWDRAEVEQLLESDAQLRDELTQLLNQGSLLWGSGPVGAESGSEGRPRLVVSEQEIFFQIV